MSKMPAEYWRLFWIGAYLRSHDCSSYCGDSLMVKAGQLNKRITFQTGSESNDGEGKTVYIDSFTVWGLSSR